MNTRSKATVPTTTAEVPTNVNAPHASTDPNGDDTPPPWARALMENMQTLTISVQANNASLQSLQKKFDQHEIRLQKLESPKKSNSWEASSSQVKIPDEPINDYPHFPNFVPSNDYYPRDMIDYQYTEARVDTPMSKEVNDLKEYLNEDMISSLPKTIPCINPTPRSNRIIRCYKCQKVGHVKADCSKLIIVMDDSNPLHTNDSKESKLEDEIHGLDKAISIKHVHIIHDIVLKKFASSYKRYKTFIAFPRRYKILKPSDLVDTKIHSPKLLKFSFKFQQKNSITFKLLLKLIHIFGIISIGAYLFHLLFQF